ncbi:hypothetical protein CV014_10470 [Nostoc sp. CMAA1605]|nr:hypothetical protein [Nostoc sp. CMAA1605]
MKRKAPKYEAQNLLVLCLIRLLSGGYKFRLRSTAANDRTPLATSRQSRPTRCLRNGEQQGASPPNNSERSSDNARGERVAVNNLCV